jgi:hypothetical protein
MQAPEMAEGCRSTALGCISQTPVLLFARR